MRSQAGSHPNRARGCIDASRADDRAAQTFERDAVAQREDDARCLGIRFDRDDVAHVHLVVGDVEQRMVVLDSDQRDVAELGGQRRDAAEAAGWNDHGTDVIEADLMRGDMIEPFDRHQTRRPGESLEHTQVVWRRDELGRCPGVVGPALAGVLIVR